MNILVLLFFIHNVLATTFLGIKFFGSKNRAFKNFGIAMLLNSLAFAIWTVAVVTRPANLEQVVTIGVIPFVISLVFLIICGVDNFEKEIRTKLIGAGVAVVACLFLVRTFVYPSNPMFTTDGYFFFNMHPIVQLVYVFGFVLTAVPAIFIISSKFKGIYAILVRYGFMAEVIGGIMLITNRDPQALLISGWVMGFVYFALWSTLLFNSKAWSISK